MNETSPSPQSANKSKTGAIRLVDTTFESPEENLAYEEVLLDRAETRGREVLRFWESPSYFVVLGVSQTLREHVHERACEEDGVPVVRRCSAGGCVLQGPGCLNFTLALTHERHPDVDTIRGSYCYILDLVCEALRQQGVAAKHKGTSDIAVRGRKISGNAQKRRRHAILHHGTLLYGMDPDLVEKYLKEPSDRPQYRGARTHRGFIKSLTVPSDALRASLRAVFEADSVVSKPTRAEIKAVRKLVAEKYGTPGWIHRR